MSKIEQFFNKILCTVGIHNWIKQGNFQRCCNKCWKVQFLRYNNKWSWHDR